MKVLLCIFFARTLAAPLDNVTLGDNMASTPGIIFDFSVFILKELSDVIYYLR